MTAALKVAVIDYGSGNLASASRGLALAAARLGLAAEVAVTADPDFVAAADRIVLPGQGAFADCARGLAAIPGLRASVLAATAAGRPFLGICVGMQLMAERGLEHEVTPGFGWVRGEIAAMEPPAALRLPHMGWNELAFAPDAHPLLDGLQPGDHAYFVHGYALAGGDPAECIATTDYGGPVVAMVASGNRAGTQFHVEKSQEVGLRILANFLRWTPTTPDTCPMVEP
jgi:glutamine amidotransferase